MKRLLLLITFSVLCLSSFTQINVQQDNRINPILRNALAARSGYYIYGRTSASGFINIAVLYQSSHTLCWFTCHGRLFDSTKLTNQEFDEVTSKQLDPFVLYQKICDSYLANIAAAKDIYRVYGDIQLLDKLNGNYRTLFAMETVQAAKTPLQKIIAIENIRKKILTQQAYLNCGSPFGLQDDPLYKIGKEQAGAMIQTKDSTVYYNIDPTSVVAKISLYKKAAGQLYIQNRFSEIIDSVAIQPEKFDLLQKEKTDVFLLYRGWLELQWQGTLSAIRRQSASLYNQVGVQNEKLDEGLYSQLNAIGTKINQLNSPEAKSIEQAVYDTYKNETTEINYIPLLGIGYSLTQTRGQKEYELTNHLGNVLVTVTDKKIGVSSALDSSLIDHYEPDIVSAQDYYPFGMLQPGRTYLSPNGDKYRYGFNGKENDNEVKGEGNQQDYGMRISDPRIGRFLSIDPLTKGFPMLTPYQFSSNSPVANIDLDGGEAKYFNIEIIETFDGKGKLINSESRHVEDKSKEAGWFAHGAFVYRFSGDLGAGTLFTYTKVKKVMKEDGTEQITIQDNGALYVPSTSDKGRGGLFFTSSSGGFNHSSGSLDENDAIPINLDLLVTVVGGFPGGNADTEMSPFQYSGDEVNKLTKLVEVLKSDKKFMEKVDKILESVKTVLNTEGAGEKKGQAIDEFLQKVNDTEKSNGKQFLQCESCGAYRKVGTKQVLPATKKDTANKGITTQNTTKIKVESFHSN